MSGSTQKYTLDTLASRANDISTNKQSCAVVDERVVATNKKPQWGGITWFIIIFLIIAVILFFFRPDLVLSTNQNTGEKCLDWGKLILCSIVFALIGILIIWLARGGARCATTTETVKCA
ncbi:hypothetical protein BH23THE1_BH23THE1_35350 [soil metagenome]